MCSLLHHINSMLFDSRLAVSHTIKDQYRGCMLEPLPLYGHSVTANDNCDL